MSARASRAAANETERERAKLERFLDIDGLAREVFECAIGPRATTDCDLTRESKAFALGEIDRPDERLAALECAYAEGRQRCWKEVKAASPPDHASPSGASSL